MPVTAIRSDSSAKALTLAAYISFIPIGIATVLLGPMLPTLSARWNLNYSGAGALFPAQYSGSTCAVFLSGLVVTKWGYRFAMKAGLVLSGLGVALLLSGPKELGIACIAAYGAGLGIAVPAANLLAAEVNPGRRGAVLSILNFCWSVGAVACPFLVAVATKIHRMPVFLGFTAGFMFLVALGIAVMPSSVVEPVVAHRGSIKAAFQIEWKHKALLALSALFLVYVGTENAFGGWVASFSKSLGNMSPAMSLMTPSFFYASLMLGRWIAPLLLRNFDDVRLVRAGLLMACLGNGILLLSHALPGVLVGASIAGIGLAAVYPITIALLSREFGASSSRVGSLMFTLSNVGGGVLPWMAGVFSTRFGTLKAGLAVPLLGSAAMLLLYLRNWKPEEVLPDLGVSDPHSETPQSNQPIESKQ